MSKNKSVLIVLDEQTKEISMRSELDRLETRRVVEFVLKTMEQDSRGVSVITEREAPTLIRRLLGGNRPRARLVD